jgi:hypothetical protein
MNPRYARRTAALALTAAVTVGGTLLSPGQASAVSRVGGIGCVSNGVTIYENYTWNSLACYEGSAGVDYDTVNGVGGVKGVYNHGYAGYYVWATGRDDVTPFYANDQRYLYDYSQTQNRTIEIDN